VSEILDCSIVPTRTNSPEIAAELLTRRGAVILSDVGTGETDARGAMRAVLGDDVLALPEACEVHEGGGLDRKPAGADEPLLLHTDGFAYGNEHPDVIGLLCVRTGVSGGESVLVDGGALVDHIAEADPELYDFLTSVDIDQTEDGMRPNLSPAVLRNSSGRRAVRRFGRVIATSPTQRSDAQFLVRWNEVCEAQRVRAQRFLLQPGEIVVADNYRMLHSRDPYEGDRLLWRVWAWTRHGNGVPSGLLHSDSRYAAT
jgi:hypothetical protein